MTTTSWVYVPGPDWLDEVVCCLQLWLEYQLVRRSTRGGKSEDMAIFKTTDGQEILIAWVGDQRKDSEGRVQRTEDTWVSVSFS